MKPLFDKARGGHRVTLIDKIGTVTSLDELDGMRAELSARGRRLTTDEMAAIEERRRQLGGR